MLPHEIAITDVGKPGTSGLPKTCQGGLGFDTKLGQLNEVNEVPGWMLIQLWIWDVCNVEAMTFISRICIYIDYII